MPKDKAGASEIKPVVPEQKKERKAPRTTGQWIWEKNPHEDRTDGFK